MLRIARPTLFLPLPPQVMLLLLTVCACLSAAPRASAQSFACVDIGTAHGDRRPLPAEYYPYSDVATDEASLAANLVGGMQSTVSIRAGDQHLGSGFIWDDQQHVVTNRHVVHDISSPIDVVVTENVYSRDDQSSIVNTVTREWRYRGAEDQVQLVGASAWHDLAVLKIKPPDLVVQPLWHPVTIAWRNPPLVGQRVYAIGTPLSDDFQRTVTHGIVSGLRRTTRLPDSRPLFDMVQTDAAINPGNSGGPLFSGTGSLVGVATSTQRDSSYVPSIERFYRTLTTVGTLTTQEIQALFWALAQQAKAEAIHFAIPVSTVCRVVPRLIEAGFYSRPRIGAREGSSERYLVSSRFVDGVRFRYFDSSATEAGLRQQDVIYGVNSFTVQNKEDLWRVLDYFRPHENVELRVLRNGNEERRVDLKLLEGPAGSDPADQLTNPSHGW